VDLATQQVAPIGDLLGKLDGLEPDGTSFWVSDFSAAQIHTVAADGTHEIAFDLRADHGLAVAADIGFDPVRRVLCVPDLNETIAFVTLP
jgi:hypothetical protein